MADVIAGVAELTVEQSLVLLHHTIGMVSCERILDASAKVDGSL